ncbi:hypothetical protein [Actinoallomurus sp. NPDC050550]|uniref:D-alanyl-D-alanine carboxypeptidase family protein n=1 Tax=Actinoallomurus sp. NPDC050550 TaxID=3154937 RepID=UPI0033F489CE
MNGASREPDNDAQHETSGTPPQDDPAPGPEPQAEAADTGAEEPAGTDARDQEDSSEPERVPESEMAADAEADPDDPSEAISADDEEDDAHTEDERQEKAEPSAERAEPASAEAEAEADATSGGDDTAASEDTLTSEDSTVPEGTSVPEDTPVPEDSTLPEGTTAHAATPDHAESEPETEEDGRTTTAEFRLPPKPYSPAASDITVSDLPRSAFPKKRTADTESRPPAHRPSPEEPQPRRSALERTPWWSSGGANGQDEVESVAPSPEAAETTAIAPPAPDRGAPEHSSWFTPAERPPAQTSATPPQTVEEALPEVRPSGQGGLASTTQRDGVPMISPPPAATTAYTAAPPPRTMPPTTPRPETSRPPAAKPLTTPQPETSRRQVAEPPPLTIPSTIAVPPPETVRPPVVEPPRLRIPSTVATPPPETARPPVVEPPQLRAPSTVATPPPETARPPVVEPPQLRTPSTVATPPPETARRPVAELAPVPVQAPSEAPAEKPRRKRRRTGWIVAVVLVLLAGVVTGQFVRPMPAPTMRLTLTATRHTFGGAAPVLPWPAQGQATLYVDGLGSMGSSGGETPTPTASVAKVMTAYVFLHDHPLQQGTDGPTYRISRQEAARLPMRKERGESLVEVVAGQAFTEHKALEALLLVSANNLAHELARWDLGEEQTFVEKMNATARSLGMTNTTYTDPSGYDSHTVSTAADQVKLLTAAMKIPAFAEIVNLRTYVPNDGRPPRAAGNVLVGRHGVVGGKTGYTDAAGGNFVFAARKRTGHVTTMIVGAVMGQQSSSAMGAIEAAQPLIVAAEKALTSVTLAPAGAQVALVDDGLGGRTPLRATAPVTVVGWGGLTVPVRVTGDPPRHAADGTRLGAVTAGSAVIPLALDRTLQPPSILKRLLRLG